MKPEFPSADEPVPADYLLALDAMDRLAAKLDYDFQVPKTNIRFGWDPVIGLVPIAGDAVSLALSIKIIAAARTLGASPAALRRMAWNAALDALVGAVPIAGTIFDIYFKANIRNVELLMAEIRKR